MGTLAGIGASKTHTPREILLSGQGATYLPINGTVNADQSRDPDNTGDINVLRPGLLMSYNPDNHKWFSPLIGITAAVFSGAGTALTLTTQAATELNRRKGGTGVEDAWLVFSRAISAGYELTAVPLTWSAINTTTGVVTVTAPGGGFTDLASGNGYVFDANALDVRAIADADGQGSIDDFDIFKLNTTVLLTKHINVFESGTSTQEDQVMPSMLVSGMINSAQIINYPSSADDVDFMFKNFLKRELRRNAGGLTFSDDFNG